jgi:hypothetical protein
MKKIVVLMILVLLGQTTIKAQTNSYIPFPKEAVWHIWKEDNHLGTTGITSINKSMQGDTVINGIKYIKYYDPTLKSAIRDEPANKKVFCYDFTSKSETVLYNFNLKIGDTVLVLKISNKDVKYWVTAIDSILLLDGKYHNRYLFSKAGPDGMVPLPELSPLVEGLGYFHGNKFDIEKATSEGITTNITVCASADKKLLIATFGVPPKGEYCGVIITAIQTPVNNSEFTIYPNPTTGKFQLQAEIPNVYAVEIINTLGEKIFSAELKNERIEIDLSNNSTGIYFVMLHTKQGNSFSRKIIKN